MNGLADCNFVFLGLSNWCLLLFKNVEGITLTNNKKVVYLNYFIFPLYTFQSFVLSLNVFKFRTRINFKLIIIEAHFKSLSRRKNWKI